MNRFREYDWPNEENEMDDDCIAIEEEDPDPRLITNVDQHINTLITSEKDCDVMQYINLCDALERVLQYLTETQKNIVCLYLGFQDGQWDTPRLTFEAIGRELGYTDGSFVRVIYGQTIRRVQRELLKILTKY